MMILWFLVGFGKTIELMDPYRTSLPPIATLSYISLTEGELEALALLNANAAVAALDEEEHEAAASASGSEGGSTEDDEILQSPSPSSLAMDYNNSDDATALIDLIKSEENDHLQALDDSLLTPPSAWRHPALIPSHIPSFLPPFPGMGHEDLVETARHKREREREELERERNDARSGRDGVTGRYLTGAGGAGGDPWITLLNIGSSTLREVPRNAYASTSLSPPPPSPSLLDSTLHSPPPRPLRNRKRSLSPSTGSSSRTSSSLESYSTSLPQIPHAPTWARPNPLRRSAAISISHSTEMCVSLDSLFGSLPIPPTRSAGVTSGFLPDNAGMGSIHPFNTALPHTISIPATPHPAPNAGLLAPNPHPRLPTILSSIATPLSLPTSAHLTLFSRLTRIAPPGPLGPKGEALEYEFLGGGGVVASNVEWGLRGHNVKLARGVREEEGKGGIRLSLNRGLGGRGGSVGGDPVPEVPGEGREESGVMQLVQEEDVGGQIEGFIEKGGLGEDRERSQTFERSESQMQVQESQDDAPFDETILPSTTERTTSTSSEAPFSLPSYPIDNSLQVDLSTPHRPHPSKGVVDLDLFSSSSHPYPSDPSSTLDSSQHTSRLSLEGERNLMTDVGLGEEGVLEGDQGR